MTSRRSSNPSDRLRRRDGGRVTWLVATLGLWVGLVGGCRDRDGDPAVDRVWIEEPEPHFERGFVELVPPIALPSSHPDLAQVRIRAKLPVNGEIDLVDGPDGEVLAFPPGTQMERLEWVGSGSERSLTDVRGATIDDDGSVWHHNYRRTRLEANAPLVGYRWRADDASAHDRAVERLVAEVAELPPAVTMSAGGRGAYLDGLRGKAACAKCHVPARPRNDVAGAHGLVNRGTDASAFFTPQTVLTDSVVLEDYGRFDPNLDRPFVTFSCLDGGAPKRRQGRSNRVRLVCEGSVAVGHFDLEAALLAGDEHARRVCASRLAQAEHLGDRALDKFERAIRMCESAER